MTNEFAFIGKTTCMNIKTLEPDEQLFEREIYCFFFGFFLIAPPHPFRQNYSQQSDDSNIISIEI